MIQSNNQFNKVRLTSRANQKNKAIWTAMILLTVFFSVEIGAGILSHSLSLLADAEHILSDVAALGVGLLAIWLSKSMSESSSKSPKNWGRYRPEVVAALVNGIGLACIAGWIIKEAVVRLQSPAPEILGLPMLITALVGLGVNSFNVFCLHGCSHQDLNIRGVFLHLVADLVSSVGTVLAAIAVIWLDWTWADGVISLVVAILIGTLAAVLVTQSIYCLRGQSTAIADSMHSAASCFCATPCFDGQKIDRQIAEKLLFPTLQEMLRSNK